MKGPKFCGQIIKPSFFPLRQDFVLWADKYRAYNWAGRSSGAQMMAGEGCESCHTGALYYPLIFPNDRHWSLFSNL